MDMAAAHRWWVPELPGIPADTKGGTAGANTQPTAVTPHRKGQERRGHRLLLWPYRGNSRLSSGVLRASAHSRKALG